MVAFETRTAKVSRSSEELCKTTPKLSYNPVSVADADKLTPNFPWSKFFESQGWPSRRCSRWRSRRSTRGSEQDARRHAGRMAEGLPALPHGRQPRRARAMPSCGNFDSTTRPCAARRKSGPLEACSARSKPGQMGEALGQMYVRSRSPESKARAWQLVQNLRDALAGSASRTWRG